MRPNFLERKMKKSLLLTMLVATIGSASAAEFMEFGSKDFKKNKLNDSKWIFDTGLNFVEYPTSLPTYSGTHESVKENSKAQIFGISLGFGREFNIGSGFSSTVKLGGFYSKTLEKSVGQAAEDVDLDLAEKYDVSMVYGMDATASINYLFENKVINIQPFVEFGAGSGASTMEKKYSFQGVDGSPTASQPELYDVAVDEAFTYSKASVGLNFISSTGIVSYVKATRMGLSVNSRKTKGSIQTQGNSKVSAENSANAKDSLEVMSATLGLGFLF
jgi:hypothetical protein